MQFVLRVVCGKTGVRVHNPGCFDTPRSELGSNSARNNTQDFADGAVRRSNLLVIEELKDLLETRLRDRTGRPALCAALVADRAEAAVEPVNATRCAHCDGILRSFGGRRAMYWPLLERAARPAATNRPSAIASVRNPGGDHHRGELTSSSRTAGSASLSASEEREPFPLPRSASLQASVSCAVTERT